MRSRAQGRARDRYKDTIFIVAVNPPALPATRNRRGSRPRISENEAATLPRDGPCALVSVIYGRARRAASAPSSREIGDTVRNVKFTSVTFIVTRTFSRCWAGRGRSLTRKCARARRIVWSVWALFYDRKPSNADRFTRKRLFAPFRRACGRPIRRP